MISLEPPLHEIDGLPIFPDHRDKQQFYYMPVQPTIAGEAQGDPRFSFMKYKLLADQSSYIGLGADRKELGGGYIAFSTTLAVAKEKVAAVEKKLQATHPGARLAPVQFTKGTVRLVTFKPDPNGFVTNVAGEGPAAVFPQHSNAFAMELSALGATALWETFKGATGPVAVGYELYYLGVRPALDVRITIDFKKTYQHFSAHLKGKYLWASADIRAQWDKLEKSGAVKIDWLGEASGKTQEMLDRIIEQVTDKFMQRLFEPRASEKPAESTGKMGWWGVGLALKYVREEELITATWDMKKEIIEERMAPVSQHLSGFYKKYGSKAKYFAEVDLNDPFFRKMAVNVTCNADFADEPIHSIVVNMKYNDPKNRISEAKSFKFTDSTTSYRFEAPQPDLNKYTYQYQTIVNYKPSRHFDSLREEGAWITAGDRELVINKNLFGLLFVNIMLASPLEDVRFAKLDLFYEDTANAHQQRETKLFRDGTESFTWQIPIKDRKLRKYKYRLTMFTNQLDAENRYITEVGPWIETEEEWLILEI